MIHELDIYDQKTREGLIDFWKEYYIQDADYVMEYSTETILWAMGKGCICLGLIVDGQLMGTVLGTPTDMCFDSKKEKMLMCNFLCIHPKMRGKHIVHEFTQTMQKIGNKLGMTRGIYSSNNDMVGAFVRYGCLHRPINYKLLCQTGFMQPVKSSLKNPFRIAGETTLRRAKKEDAAQISKLFYDMDYAIHPMYSASDIELLINVSGESKNLILMVDNEVKRLVLLCGIVMRYAKCVIRNAMLHYMVGEPFNTIHEAITISRDNGFDVMTMLAWPHLVEAAGHARFCNGTGSLCYYIYPDLLNVSKKNVYLSFV